MAESVLVAWCGACQHYEPVKDIGKQCSGEDCKRKLRKRRGYICDRCEEGTISFSLASLNSHKRYQHDVR